MNPLEAETLRLLEEIRKAKEAMRRALENKPSRQDLLYFRHREEGKR